LRLRLEAAARKSDDPAVRRDLEAAEAETERLAALLANLLILAREEGPESDLPEIPLARVVEDARDRWEATAAGEGRELRLEGGQHVTVCARPDELAAILDNLLENALKYSPQGADVALGWRVVVGCVWVEVADAGPGIPESERDAVFERFYRGEASGDTSGTGLGLPIAAALARRSRAVLRLRDREGGGTVASLELRLAGRAPERPPAAAGRER
jgi:signal transduction histidine kinase